MLGMFFYQKGITPISHSWQCSDFAKTNREKEHNCKEEATYFELCWRPEARLI